MIDESTIAGRIKFGRNSVRMTQQELADKIGVSLVTITRWENPDSGRSPNTLMLNKIAEALGISAGYLFGVEGDPANIEPYQEKALPFKKTNNSLVYERNGERLELPPTEESYKIIREIALLIAGREIGSGVPAVNQ